MEVTGKIKVVNPTQQVSASFKKRELVVTTDEQYPQHIMIEFTQDKTDLLDQYRAGEDVKVSINLRGREWVSPQGETRYFNTIQGWRIERVQAGAPEQQQYQQQPQYQQPQMPPAQSFAPAQNFNEEEHDDLPF
ncbi:DUF3127 domain-containing protein [Flavobacterium sp. MAH-1]|uniref:DUF3127 domain-containing protein n=1 Tax=Flavobacterium agri TaxID=2743471 RepID=A0A7Y9C616_9FLAO|nr:DUF3127 domain-containing protein [Flavobacterium agri]NUY81556.1 DUF3127 domain-containing protein [Flavobacterium agri]NYA71580.1 DUF3127 domain-containing protein [Flavobacterium agri]